MKTVVIYSPYKCLIKNEKEEVVLDENEHLIIDNPSKLFVYPLGKTTNYSFFIDLKNEDNKFYRLIEKDNKTLIFLLDGLLTENVDLYFFQYNDIKSEIEVKNQSIVFSCNNHKKIITLPVKVEKYSCGNFYHINYFHYTDQNGENIITYNNKNNNAKLFKGDEIEILENGFTVKTNEKGLYKKVNEDYFVDEEGLKSGAKTFSLTDNVAPNELALFNFMNALKKEDYQSAYDLLDKTLQDKISQQTLKEYFGKISYYYVIDNKTCFALSNNKNMIYTFSLNEKYITDISDNN